MKILAQRVDALLTEAGHLQVTPEDLLKLIHERHQSLQPHTNR
jgi:hypothetical protein